MSGQPVSQNARIAAERLATAMGLPFMAEQIVSGEANHSAIVQAFARFESATIERLTAAQVDVERLRVDLSKEAVDWRHNAYSRVVFARMHDRLAALSATDREEVPAGFVLVPREPTEAMWDAAWDAGDPYFVGDNISESGLRVALSAMLAASPVADQEKE